MSDIDFALSGPSGEHLLEWDYDRQCEDEITFAPAEPTFVEQKNFVQRPLNQRISYNADQKFTFSLVDNLIQVKSFSMTFREAKADFWKSKRTSMVLVSTVLGTGLSVGLGTFVTPAAATVGVALGCFGLYRGYQAHSQIGLWQRDLPEAIAIQRREAFNSGLLPIYKQDELGATSQPALYTKVLSSTELNGLYLEYLDTFQKEMNATHDPKKKVQFLEHAAKYSPLTEKMMNYVRLHPYYGTPLASYHHEHNKFVKTFNIVESIISEKIDEVNKTAQENISSVEQSKLTAIGVANTTYTLYKNHEDSKLKEKLESYPEGTQYNHYRSTAQAEYDAAVRQARTIRDTSIRLLSLPFDSRISSLEAERDDYIKEIKRNRDAYLLPIYSHIAELHREAQLVVTGARPPRQAFNPSGLYPQFPEFPVMQPIPSAPTLEEIFRDERQEYDAHVFDEILGIYRQEAGKA